MTEVSDPKYERIESAEKEKLPDTLGQCLKALRRGSEAGLRPGKKITQREVAKALNISESYINLIENNQKVPSLETLFRFVMYFHNIPESNTIPTILIQKQKPHIEEQEDSGSDRDDMELNLAAAERFKYLTPMLYSPKNFDERRIQDIFNLWKKAYMNSHLRRNGVKPELMEAADISNKILEEAIVDLRTQMEQLRNSLQKVTGNADEKTVEAPIQGERTLISNLAPTLTQRSSEKWQVPDDDYLNYFRPSEPVEPRKAVYTPLSSTDPNIEIEYT